jgi:hypothetical protein
MMTLIAWVQLVILVVVAPAGAQGHREKLDFREQGFLRGIILRFLISAGQKQANQWRTREPQDFRRVCFQLMGEATTAFQNLNGYFGAAEGKVPLLMVCVKP